MRKHIRAISSEAEAAKDEEDEEAGDEVSPRSARPGRRHPVNTGHDAPRPEEGDADEDEEEGERLGEARAAPLGTGHCLPPRDPTLTLGPGSARFSTRHLRGLSLGYRGAFGASAVGAQPLPGLRGFFGAGCAAAQ